MRMERFAAFLRGVSPMNAKMPELARAFEAAGFRDVRTVLSSGNVVFSARAASGPALEKKAEAAMESLPTAFPAIVRPVAALRELLAADPFEALRVPSGAKRVVTFLRARPRAVPELPIELDGARILRVEGGEVFTAYVPSPRGAVFMSFIEKTFGKDVTTRTWDTLRKVVVAAER